jgi:hypothetical protein
LALLKRLTFDALREGNVELSGLSYDCAQLVVKLIEDVRINANSGGFGSIKPLTKDDSSYYNTMFFKTCQLDPEHQIDETL